MGIIANTSAGTLRGLRLPAGDVDAFLGIPYAAPPVGARRWCAPQPLEPWTGIHDAVRFGPIAYQRLHPSDSLFAFETENQQEDCLYLNVWTGAGASAAPRPVIVWFHIGAFQYGSGSAALYDGANWARAGVVFVSLNFRLGRLGFLAHPELTAEAALSGNYGLLDQIAALEWVRDNIAQFGGDPQCVTIFGVSAGSSSVSLLMNAPRARGLFHRAIAESGGSFGPVGTNTGLGDRWQTLKAAEDSGVSWANAIGQQSLADLRAMDGYSLHRANDRPAELGHATFDALRPIIDGSIIPQPSFALFAVGQQAPVPLLVGSAAQEEFVVASVGGGAAGYRQSARAEYGDWAEEFLTLYPGRSDEEAAQSALRALGDRVFTWQNWTWANMHARQVADTYYYRFEQAPPVPAGRYHENRDGRSLGAFHGASIFYSFGNLDARDWPWTGADRRFCKTLIRTWVHFARTGKPMADGIPDWPRFDPDNPSVMRLSAASAMGPVPEHPRLRFWDDFFGVMQVQRERMG